MKRFVSLILSVCFLFSINTVSYAANISSRKASNPVIQSMNDKYHVDFSGMSIRTSSPFSANLALHSSAHVCRQYSSVSGLPQSVVGTALKTNSPFWSRIRLPSSSSSYTRRCFSPHLPFCSMGRMGQST